MGSAPSSGPLFEMHVPKARVELFDHKASADTVLIIIDPTVATLDLSLLKRGDASSLEYVLTMQSVIDREMHLILPISKGLCEPLAIFCPPMSVRIHLLTESSRSSLLVFFSPLLLEEYSLLQEGATDTFDEFFHSIFGREGFDPFSLNLSPQLLVQQTPHGFETKGCSPPEFLPPPS